MELGLAHSRITETDDYSVYLMCEARSASSLGYPSEDLIDDLLTTLLGPSFQPARASG
jgi:hypothetical protein